MWLSISGALVLTMSCGSGNGADGDGDADTDSDTDTDTDVDTDVDVDADGDADDDADGDADGGTDSGTDGDADSDADLDNDADIDSDADGEADAEGAASAWDARITETYAWSDMMPPAAPNTIVIATVRYENLGTTAIRAIETTATLIRHSDGATLLDVPWPSSGSFSGELPPRGVESVSYRHDAPTFSAGCGDVVRLVVEASSDAGNLVLQSEPFSFDCPM
jgi:hypothetical protein